MSGIAHVSKARPYPSDQTEHKAPIVCGDVLGKVANGWDTPSSDGAPSPRDSSCGSISTSGRSTGSPYSPREAMVSNTAGTVVSTTPSSSASTPRCSTSAQSVASAEDSDMDSDSGVDEETLREVEKEYQIERNQQTQQMIKTLFERYRSEGMSINDSAKKALTEAPRRLAQQRNHYR